MTRAFALVVAVVAVVSVVGALAARATGADEPGFGGGPPVDDPAADDAAADVVTGDGASGAPTGAGDAMAGDAAEDGRSSDVARATATLPTWAGVDDGGSAPRSPTRTKLEDELARAHLDPARHPLLQLRVDVARLHDELAAAEARGLTSARGVEERHAAAAALLADVERIALHRLQRCVVRTGQPVAAVKNHRMTAGGAVALSTSELLGQASVLDPPGCARIDLIDQAVVDRVRRARAVRIELRDRTFPFHRLDERRALEAEGKALAKQLADDGLAVVLIPGERGFGR